MRLMPRARNGIRQQAARLEAENVWVNLSEGFHVILRNCFIMQAREVRNCFKYNQYWVN